MKTILAAAFLLVGCGANEAAPPATVKRIDLNASQADQQLIRAGLVTLNKLCPGLSRYGDDLFQHETAKIGEANLSDQRERGWKRAVTVELKVSDQPKAIPSSFYSAGHTCYFDVGVAAPIGVSISKRPCVSICLDKKTDNAQPVFIPDK